jgi:hypothetical protein
MCYKYNIVLELAKFEKSFLALILGNNKAGGAIAGRQAMANYA